MGRQPTKLDKLARENTEPARRPTRPLAAKNMLLMLAPPADLQDWIQSGVVLRGASTLHATQFPALVESLLVVRMSGTVFLDASDSTPLPESALILPTTRFSSYAHAGAVHAVGLVLRPEAASCLLQESLEGWAHQHLCLTDVWGDSFRRSVQDILDAKDDHARIHILFECFRRHVLTPRNERRRAQLHQIGQAMAGDLAEACRTMGLGSRQLQRRCLAGYGITPKQYQVTTRLHSTLRMALQSSPRGSSGGVGLALENGFFDQSHMARDVRRLAGVPLRDFPDRNVIQQTPHWPLAVGMGLS